jgi:hypothetical protein
MNLESRVNARLNCRFLQQRLVELPRVGHPLVHQNQARAVFVEQLTLHVAGAGRIFMVGLDTREGFLPAQLPCQFAP